MIKADSLAFLIFRGKPDKDIEIKKNYRPISLINIIEAKILNQIVANIMQKYIKIHSFAMTKSRQLQEGKVYF